MLTLSQKKKKINRAGEMVKALSEQQGEPDLQSLQIHLVNTAVSLQFQPLRQAEQESRAHGLIRLDV